MATNGMNMASRRSGWNSVAGGGKGDGEGGRVGAANTMTGLSE